MAWVAPSLVAHKTLNVYTYVFTEWRGHSSPSPLGTGWYQFQMMVLELMVSTLRDVRATGVQVSRARAPGQPPKTKTGAQETSHTHLWSACMGSREHLWALGNSCPDFVLSFFLKQTNPTSFKICALEHLW